MKYFTSDTHFFHKNLMKYMASRSVYSDVQKMNNHIRDKWNEAVTIHDEVFVIGDFIFKAPKHDMITLLESLNGKIYLIPGDHDHHISCFSGHQKIRVCNNVHEINPLPGRTEPVILCHWSFRVWRKSHYGSWHLFGHIHEGLDEYGKSFNVGFDQWNKLLSENDIIEIMERRQQNKNFIPIDKRKLSVGVDI